MKKRSFDLSMLIIGALLFALAVKLFIIPNDFGEGGVTGISIILFFLSARMASGHRQRRSERRFINYRIQVAG